MANLNPNRVSVDHGVTETDGMYLKVHDVGLKLNLSDSEEVQQVIDDLTFSADISNGTYVDLHTGYDGSGTWITMEAMVNFMKRYGVPLTTILFYQKESGYRRYLPKTVYQRTDEWFGAFSTSFYQAISQGKEFHMLGGSEIDTEEACVYRFMMANILNALEEKIGHEIGGVHAEIRKFSVNIVNASKYQFADFDVDDNIQFSMKIEFFQALYKQIYPNAKQREVPSKLAKKNYEQRFAKVIIPGTFQRRNADAGGINFFRKVGEWQYTCNYNAIKKFIEM